MGCLNSTQNQPNDNFRKFPTTVTFLGRYGYLLGWQDFENFVPPLQAFETAVNKQLFVNDSSFAGV